MSRSEFDRIARLTARFGAPPPPDLGIGDDAAVIHPRGALVATVDAAVEGVHFLRSFASMDVLSARAVEAAASDVAAMGASFGGGGLLLSWSLPPWVDDDVFDALTDGAQRAAVRLGARVLGGNLTSGAALALHTTALASPLGEPVTRSGATPGDRVYVSGPIGAAAVGLRALLAGREAEPALTPFVDRWRRPRARVDRAPEVSSRCSAAIDVSDGLAQDALHLARASGAAIELAVHRLPVLPAQAVAAAALVMPLNARPKPPEPAVARDRIVEYFERDWVMGLHAKHRGNLTEISRESAIARKDLARRLKSWGVTIREK